jgi:hypothetical protein
VLPGVVLFSKIESELLDEVEHEGVVYAYPGGAAVHWTVLSLLQPLEIGIGAILGRLAESQGADAAANAS